MRYSKNSTFRPEQVAELQEYIEALRKEIDELRTRIKALEAAS